MTLLTTRLRRRTSRQILLTESKASILTMFHLPALRKNAQSSANGGICLCSYSSFSVYTIGREALCRAKKRSLLSRLVRLAILSISLLLGHWIHELCINVLLSAQLTISAGKILCRRSTSHLISMLQNLYLPYIQYTKSVVSVDMHRSST